MSSTKYLILLLVYPVTLMGQIKQMSLQECIDLAKEKNIQVQNQKHTISKLEEDLTISKGLFLPNLGVSTTQSYNLGDSFNVSTNLGQRESSSSLLGLSSSMVLFNGKATVNQLKYAKLNAEKGSVELEKIKRELELLITNAYLQALLFKEAITAAKNQLKVSKQQLARVKVLYKNGIITKNELLENHSLVETDRKNNIDATVNYKNSLLRISELISLESIEELDIQELNILETEGAFFIKPEDNYYKNIDTHPILSASEKEIQLQEIKLKIDKAAYYPSLSFNYEFGSAYYHLLGEEDLVFNSVTNEFEGNGFSRQLENNKSHNLIFSLSIPIFNRFETRSTVKKSKEDYEITKLNFIENKKLFSNQLKVAYNDMVGSKAVYNSTKKSVEFQEEAFRVSTEQYEAGVISVYNFVDSKNRLLNSESDFIKSKYEYLLKIKILEFYAY